MAPDRNDDRPPESKDALDRWAEQGGGAGKPSGEADEKAGEGKAGGKGKKRSPFANPWVRIAIVIVVLLLIAGAVIWWLISRHYEDTDDAFIDTHIVHVSPQIAGQVIALPVTDNQLVRRGQLVAEINAQDAEAKLAQAEAQGAQAQTQLEQALANQTAAQA